MTASLLLVAAFAATFPQANVPDGATFDERRFAGVVRQVAEPSCATASIATLLQMRFGQTASEGDLWLAYLATLPEAKLAETLSKGLSVGDIVRVLDRLHYRASAVRIGLLDLARTGQPAIVHLRRDGANPFQHFAIFERLEGVTVVLRDPAYGVRRIHVSAFRRYWSGVAVFVSENPG